MATTAQSASRARVAHHVPGRMRLRLDRGVDVQATAQQIHDTLISRDGFHRVEANPSARSVVVHYNPTQLELAHLLDEGIFLGVLDLVGEGTREIAKAVGGTRVSNGVVGSVASVNAGIGRVTGGLLDLRDVFPLTLFGFGIRRLAQGSLQAMPWYTLLFYGYSTFYALHGSKSAAEPDAPEIARRRFARGEISADELRRILAELAGIESIAEAIESTVVADAESATVRAVASADQAEADEVGDAEPAEDADEHPARKSRRRRAGHGE